MSKPIICITEKEYQKAKEIFDSSDAFVCLSAPCDEASLAHSVRQHRAFGVIVGVESYRDLLYQVLPRGGIIARFGVGHDGIDKAKATAQGLVVANTPGALDQSVAEHAIFLLGALARQIARCDQAIKAGQWVAAMGAELAGKTLLVIGCGAIGRAVARIAAFGFGMRVVGYDVRPLDARMLREQCGIQAVFADLSAALSEADFASLHLPATAATRHFVNAEFLSKLKPTCALVNTARGLVVDEAALYDALASGRLAGAALDVFENEPYCPVHPDKDLRRLDNVVLTPHIASSTRQACCRMARQCLKNARAAYEKRYNDVDLVNLDVLDRLK